MFATPRSNFLTFCLTINYRLAIRINTMKIKLFFLSLAVSFILGGSSLSFADASIQHPMTFSAHQENWGSGSEFYVLAEGIIEEDTPEKFRSFIAEIRRMPTPTVYFNSPGGNLHAGLRLGRIIRKLCLDTHVGGPYEETAEHIPNLKVLAERGVCFSAAAYAFLGGNTRSIGERGLLGIHQFSGLVGKNYSADTQITMTLLANYLDEMGVDRQLLDVASFTPLEEMLLLPQEIARALNVDNTDPPKSKWQIDVTENGSVFAFVKQRQPRKNGLLTMVIRPQESLLIALVVYQLHQCQCFRSEKEMERSFSENRTILLCSGEVEIKPLLFRNWRKVDCAKFDIEFLLTAEQVSTLLRKSEFRFDVCFPNALRDIDPSVNISTDGLRPAFLAIMKQVD